MSTFDDAIPTILVHEGGLSDDPDDPGGVTKYGISQAAYPSFTRQDILNLTLDEAAVIYRRDYWNGFDAIDSQAVATKLLDMAVNIGSGTAIRLLQLACNAFGHVLTVDGRFGPATAAATNTVDEQQLLNQLVAMVEDHYHSIVARRPADAKFLEGWLNRAGDLRAYEWDDVRA